MYNKYTEHMFYTYLIIEIFLLPKQSSITGKGVGRATSIFACKKILAYISNDSQTEFMLS